MQFLALIESIAGALTSDNIETVVSLVDKLITLAESMEGSKSNPKTPIVTPPTA